MKLSVVSSQQLPWFHFCCWEKHLPEKKPGGERSLSGLQVQVAAHYCRGVMAEPRTLQPQSRGERADMHSRLLALS